MGQHTSIGVDNDQTRKVARLLAVFFKVIFYLIHLAVCGAPTLSDRPVAYRRVGALGTKLETCIERISALKPQVASKNAKVVAKVAQIDGLERCLRMTREGSS